MQSAEAPRSPDGAGEAAASLGGYRKGEEASARILEAALRSFGATGFKATTTRQLAEDAQVNLPALKYYFGSKEGLYLACAREIVGRYEAHMLALVADARAALGAGLSPAAARSRLKEVMGALAELLVGSPEAEIWTSFVLREMADQGPAFTILYEQLWAPGIALIANLISRARGEDAPSPSARIEALLLISSLTAFSTARPVALRYLAWPDTDGARFASVRHVIDEQIDRIG